MKLSRFLGRRRKLRISDNLLMNKSYNLRLGSLWADAFRGQRFSYLRRNLLLRGSSAAHGKRIVFPKRVHASHFFSSYVAVYVKCPILQFRKIVMFYYQQLYDIWYFY